MQSVLLDRTQQLFRDRPRHRTIVQISMETEIPEDWLRKFAVVGKQKTPNVYYVETLYRHLSGKSLEI